MASQLRIAQLHGVLVPGKELPKRPVSGSCCEADVSQVPGVKSTHASFRVLRPYRRLLRGRRFRDRRRAVLLTVRRPPRCGRAVPRIVRGQQRRVLQTKSLGVSHIFRFRLSGAFVTMN